MNQVDFVAFIGEVINTTRVVESRNARLKVIVEMAKEILAVTDVTVEMEGRENCTFCSVALQCFSWPGSSQED
jgi:CRISPR/Cas system-associated exonuclease Cas4 (RecB family)